MANRRSIKSRVRAWSVWLRSALAGELAPCSDFDAWRRAQPLCVRIATSRPYEVIARLLVPADRVHTMAFNLYMDAIFNASQDVAQGRAPQWREVLSLGFLRRRSLSREVGVGGRSA